MEDDITASLKCIDHACARAYGPQLVWVSDPYNIYPPLYYCYYGDISSDQVNKILNDTYCFCSDDVLRRLLAEFLTDWWPMVRQTIQYGGDAEEWVFSRYGVFASRRLLGHDCDPSVRQYTTTFLFNSLVRVLEEEPLQNRVFHVGGENAFIRHFNSCACVCQSIEPLWEKWWSLESYGATRQAGWFIYTLCGDGISTEYQYIDTRFISWHYVTYDPAVRPFWPAETVTFLREKVEWRGLLELLIDRIDKFRLESESDAWGILKERLKCDDKIQRLVKARFDTYVQCMSEGRCEWSAWEAVE